MNGTAMLESKAARDYILQFLEEKGRPVKCSDLWQLFAENLTPWLLIQQSHCWCRDCQELFESAEVYLHHLYRAHRKSLFRDWRFEGKVDPSWDEEVPPTRVYLCGYCSQVVPEGLFPSSVTEIVRHIQRECSLVDRTQAMVPIRFKTIEDTEVIQRILRDQPGVPLVVCAICDAWKANESSARSHFVQEHFDPREVRPDLEQLKDLVGEAPSGQLTRQFRKSVEEVKLRWAEGERQFCDELEGLEDLAVKRGYCFLKKELIPLSKDQVKTFLAIRPGGVTTRALIEALAPGAGQGDQEIAQFSVLFWAWDGNEVLFDSRHDRWFLHHQWESLKVEEEPPAGGPSSRLGRQRRGLRGATRQDKEGGGKGD